ncbi:MAG: hypothetical protein ACI83D_000165 [Planctomycetota bacterium]|jgi:hypothetical protein
MPGINEYFEVVLAVSFVVLWSEIVALANN